MIHQKLFEIEHIDSSYELEEIARPVFDPELRHALKTFDGMNVTIPYKVDVIPYLDELSPEAKTIGAVNTIAKKEGKLIGYNTDYTGFQRTLTPIGAEVSENLRWSSATEEPPGPSFSVSLTKKLRALR